MTLDHKNEVECISVVNSLVSCPVFLTWALVLLLFVTTFFSWSSVPIDIVVNLQVVQSKLM